MSRWICIISSVCLICWTTPVLAHLTGAFANFLEIVHDESTVDTLKTEMEETEKEIEQLLPRIDKMEDEYRLHQDEAIDKLQLYSEVGLDTWLALMMEEESLVDILGRQWMIERSVDTYLAELNKLYLAYMQLQSAKDSLEGHHQLLTMIEENLVQRKTFLMENEGIELEQLANYLDIDWTSEVEDNLMGKLKQDRQLTETKTQDWVHQVVVNMDYTLDEAWLNERSDLVYFFRADHVYVVYKKADIHVILLGQVLQTANHQGSELIFEAGFFNGFLLPDTLVEELTGLHIPYESLKKLSGIHSPYIEQSNGGLRIRTK